MSIFFTVIMLWKDLYSEIFSKLQHFDVLDSVIKTIRFISLKRSCRFCWLLHLDRRCFQTFRMLYLNFFQLGSDWLLSFGFLLLIFGCQTQMVILNRISSILLVLICMFFLQLWHQIIPAAAYIVLIWIFNSDPNEIAGS